MKNTTPIFDILESSAEMAERNYRRLLKEHKPSVYLLMSAGWASGLTVNGIGPA